MSGNEKKGKFPTTDWQVIESIQDWKAEAWNEFVRRYRWPVISFVLRCGISRPDSEDIAQTVFMLFYERRRSLRIDRTKGRFRSYLFAAVRNAICAKFRHAHAAKRGGNNPVVFSDFCCGGTGMELDVEDSRVLEAKKEFDRKWAEHLLERAMTILKDESKLMDLPHFEIVRLKYLEGKTHREIRTIIKRSERETDRFVKSGTQHYRRIVQDLIRLYCRDWNETGIEYDSLGEVMSSCTGFSLRF